MFGHLRFEFLCNVALSAYVQRFSIVALYVQGNLDITVFILSPVLYTDIPLPSYLLHNRMFTAVN